MKIIWYMALEIKGTTEFFAILGHFLPFDPPNNPKNHNFEKNEKQAWRFYYFTLAYHKWQSYDKWILRYWAWLTEFFVILGHFFPYAPRTTWKTKILKKWKKTNNNHNWRPHHFTLVYNKWRIIWCMAPEIWSVTNIIFSDFGLYLALLLLHPLNGPENQNFKKLKKVLGDIIILHTCTINNNPMMYGSWNMEGKGQNFLSFWTIFCPFTPLTTQKIKI